MALLTARSSTIFIATGEQTRVYHKVEEIPPGLRRKLRETTCGLNSATILIADKRGRQELLRALQEQPQDMPRPVPAAPPAPSKRLDLGSLRTWLELLLPVAIGGSLWLLIESQF